MTKIQQRHDTTANWELYDPILAEGEIGVDTTLGKMKVGNGTSLWSQLEYIGAGGGGASSFSDLEGSPYDNTELADTLNNKQKLLTAGDGIKMEEYYPDAVPTEYYTYRGSTTHTLTEEEAREYSFVEGENYVPFSDVNMSRKFEYTVNISPYYGYKSYSERIWKLLQSTDNELGGIEIRFDISAKTIKCKHIGLNNNSYWFGDTNTFTGQPELFSIKVVGDPEARTVSVYIKPDNSNEWLTIGTVAYDSSKFPFDFSNHKQVIVYQYDGGAITLNMVDNVVFQYIPARPSQTRISTSYKLLHITQEAYDELATKDPNTLYIITE